MPPTGDCYRQAYDRLMELTSEGDRDIHLCHGRVTNPNGSFVHAWVEAQGGKFVIEATAPDGDDVYEAEHYYGALSVEVVIKYTPTESRVLLIRSGHYGPWDPSLGGDEG